MKIGKGRGAVVGEEPQGKPDDTDNITGFFLQIPLDNGEIGRWIEKKASETCAGHKYKLCVGILPADSTDHRHGNEHIAHSRETDGNDNGSAGG